MSDNNPKTPDDTDRLTGTADAPVTAAAAAGDWPAAIAAAQAREAEWAAQERELLGRIEAAEEERRQLDAHLRVVVGAAKGIVRSAGALLVTGDPTLVEDTLTALSKHVSGRQLDHVMAFVASLLDDIDPADVSLDHCERIMLVMGDLGDLMAKSCRLRREATASSNSTREAPLPIQPAKVEP